MSRKSKGCLIVLVSVVAFIALYTVGVNLWSAGWGNRTFTEGASTRVQYYLSPPLLAVHVKIKDGTPKVMVIRNITGKNAEQMGEFLNTEEADLDHIDLEADSIYNRWSDRTEDRDILQMGVFGMDRKPPPTSS